MFRRIVIHLDGPICTCEQEKLAWFMRTEVTQATDADPTESSSLEVYCTLCNTRLLVPSDKFVASFELATPYQRPRARRRLTVMDGGKVIEFPKGPSAGEGA